MERRDSLAHPRCVGLIGPGENADLNQVERRLHRLLTLAATSAFALVTASAIAADVPAAADPDIVRLSAKFRRHVSRPTFAHWRAWHAAFVIGDR